MTSSCFDHGNNRPIEYPTLISKSGKPLVLEDIDFVAGSGAVPLNRRRFGSQLSRARPGKLAWIERCGNQSPTKIVLLRHCGTTTLARAIRQSLGLTVSSPSGVTIPDADATVVKKECRRCIDVGSITGSADDAAQHRKNQPVH
jgi:hypothetical protein